MDPARPKIVLAEALSDSARMRLEDFGQVVCLDACDTATLMKHVGDCSALVVRSYAPVTAEVIAAAPALKVIARAGIGVENIDVQAARQAGVTVVHTPAASTQAVAELVVGLIINLERSICATGRQLREGEFLEARNALAQREMREIVVGIIGFGRIGQRVGAVLHDAFGTTIIFNDIREVRTHRIPTESVSKTELYERADVVTLHVPLTDATRNLISADVLRKMKSTSLLINTSRGAVVNAGDLADALRSGTIAGAAIDVFDPEPPPSHHPLLTAPNCLLTPHIGSRSRNALAAMNAVVDDVGAVLDGRTPKWAYVGS